MTPEAAGYDAGLSGEGTIYDNPHSTAQGSPTRVAAIAWRTGFLRGQREREIAEDDAAGDLFRGRAT